MSDVIIQIARKELSRICVRLADDLTCDMPMLDCREDDVRGRLAGWRAHAPRYAAICALKNSMSGTAALIARDSFDETADLLEKLIGQMPTGEEVAHV